MKDMTVTVSIKPQDVDRVWDAVNHALRDLRDEETPIKWFWHDDPSHIYDYTDV